MKALFFEQHGGIDVLKYADLPDPQPALGEALVRVKAVALNHLDIWVREGWRGLRLKMPHISGSDIAGEIVSVNTPGPSEWTPGTRVIINPGVITSEDEWTRRGEDSISPGYRLIGEHLKGGLAEYVTVPVRNVFKLPSGISFEEGAAPLLVGTTCWRMLFKRAKIQPGETLLVVGAGGGVNSLAIMLAKAAGVTVYALAGSKKKKELAEKLGCTQVFNYHEHPQWPEKVLKATKGRGVDVVVDNVGAQTFAKSLQAVCLGGRIVIVGGTSGQVIKFDNRQLFRKQVSVLGSTIGSRQDFMDVLEFMWRNSIRPIIDRVAPLKQGIEMVQYLEEGKQFGKIILKP